MPERSVEIPRYYRPWPHQQNAWARRATGKYTYYIKLWARQLGKDSDDIEHALYRSWTKAGQQTAYVGLDNVWITNNIFKKYIDGRTFWQDYPDDLIEAKETQKEVYMLNNPADLAPSRIKFIGFLNDQQLIGSSYDNFYISEASLYGRNAFQYITPIWERKLARGLPLHVSLNGTPRGMRNVFYDMLKVYTGHDDPSDFPGEHHVAVGDTWCYVDKVRIQDALVPNARGEMVRLYDDEAVEKLKDQYLRAYGNLNLYYQENECDFTVVNAGLVYQGVESLQNEGRFTPMNLDSSRPVYVAFDISSKDKMTDATAGIVYQYYNGRMVVYDWIEARGKALVDVVAELSRRDYFHLIRMGVLPWDSDRSASSEAPVDEVRRVFPNINWHVLQKERIDRGIQLVRNLIPNMVINSKLCDYVLECLNNYEYKRLERADDWSPKPMHNRYSHLMDALRYAAMGIGEADYLKMNADGSFKLDFGYYGGIDDEDEPDDNDGYPITMRKRRKRNDSGFSYIGF